MGMHVKGRVCLTIVRPQTESCLTSPSLSLLLVHAPQFPVGKPQAVSMPATPTSALQSYSIAKTLESPVPYLNNQDPCHRPQ